MHLAMLSFGRVLYFYSKDQIKIGNAKQKQLDVLPLSAHLASHSVDHIFNQKSTCLHIKALVSQEAKQLQAVLCGHGKPNQSLPEMNRLSRSGQDSGNSGLEVSIFKDSCTTDE